MVKFAAPSCFLKRQLTDYFPLVTIENLRMLAFGVYSIAFEVESWTFRLREKPAAR
jgi:hypothetical protein